MPKWFYLQAQSEDFETAVEGPLKEIRRRSPLFGTIPTRKKKTSMKIAGKNTNGSSSKSKKKSNDDESDEFRDTSRPRMFGDEPVVERLKKASKISDLMNLGPATEKSLTKAGIKTVDQFVKLGWKKVLVKLVELNPKNRH